ncbi:MAG: universal stress protein [Flavobacteriales bacterium]
MPSDKKILLPTDFTKVGDVAMDHALLMGKTIGADVYALHIVEHKRQVSEAREKMNELQERVRRDKGSEIYPLVRIGNIYEDIDKTAVEMDCSLIIMGTHGLRGLQFLTGGRALKIVTESSVPFIIVQERTIRAHGYHRLVVPLDLHKETKQKLSLVADIAKYFNSKVFLVSPGETDEFLRNQLMRNIIYAKDYLEDKDIPYDVEITESKTDGFVKALLKYSASVEADLICIMNFQGGSIMNFFSQGYEQQVITNEAQIPVLCVNPVDTFVMEQASFTP